MPLVLFAAAPGPGLFGRLARVWIAGDIGCYPVLLGLGLLALGAVALVSWALRRRPEGGSR